MTRKSNLQKCNCRTKLENLLCLKTVGMISEQSRSTSYMKNESPVSDQPAIFGEQVDIILKHLLKNCGR